MIQVVTLRLMYLIFLRLISWADRTDPSPRRHHYGRWLVPNPVTSTSSGVTVSAV